MKGLRVNVAQLMDELGCFIKRSTKGMPECIYLAWESLAFGLVDIGLVIFIR